MINYYYEIKDDVTVFGKTAKYLSLTDVKPPIKPWIHVHEEALKHSSRVWIENANGVTLVKGPARGRVNEQELVWLKLVCRDIETL